MSNNSGIKYGIIAGVGVSIYFLLFYFVDRSSMLGLTAFYTSFLIYIGAMVLAVRQDRAKQKGIISKSIAMRSAFTCFIVANVIYYLFYYLMFNIVDTQLETTLREISINRFTEYYADRDGFDEMIKTVQEADYGFGLYTAIRGLAGSIIGGFVISFIIATFMKNEP